MPRLLKNLCDLFKVSTESLQPNISRIQAMLIPELKKSLTEEDSKTLADSKIQQEDTVAFLCGLSAIFSKVGTTLVADLTSSTARNIDITSMIAGVRETRLSNYQHSHPTEKDFVARNQKKILRTLDAILPESEAIYGSIKASIDLALKKQVNINELLSDFKKKNDPTEEDLSQLETAVTSTLTSATFSEEKEKNDTAEIDDITLSDVSRFRFYSRSPQTDIQSKARMCTGQALSMWLTEYNNLIDNFNSRLHPVLLQASNTQALQLTESLTQELLLTSRSEASQSITLKEVKILQATARVINPAVALDQDLNKVVDDAFLFDIALQGKISNICNEYFSSDDLPAKEKAVVSILMNAAVNYLETQSNAELLALINNITLKIKLSMHASYYHPIVEEQANSLPLTYRCM